MNIAIISGSNRIGRQSHNVAQFLEKHLTSLGHTVDLLDVHEIGLPVMEERVGIHPDAPSNLQQTSDRLTAAQAMVFVSPEYNGGYAGSLKNFVDYFKKEFGGKVIGVCSVSAGGMAGMRGALQMQHLVLALGGIAIPKMLLVPTVQDNFGEGGELINPDFQKSIDGFTNMFVEVAGKLSLV